MAGRYAVDYDEEQTAAAFDVLIDACPDCAAIKEKREVHVWAAATPQVLVTPRAFLEDERRPTCRCGSPTFGCASAASPGKPSLLEVQFSITAIAHVAFGLTSPSGEGRTLFTLDAAFLHVLFDNRKDFHSVSPVETQGIETRGVGFDALAAMDEPARLAFLRAIQPMLATAASRLLGARECESPDLRTRVAVGGASDLRLDVRHGLLPGAGVGVRDRGGVRARAAGDAIPRRQRSGRRHVLMTCEDARDLLKEFE